MTAFRRGFKADSARLVAEVRREVAVDLADPVDPMVVAQAYGVPVLTVAELGWAGRAPSAFSAFTVFRGHRRLIL